MKFAELPSDLNDQLESSGTVPWWFPVTGVITTTMDPTILNWYSRQFNGMDPSASLVTTSLSPNWSSQLRGLGDREEETEVNPIEVLQELRLKQEMNKAIPLIANRYTSIDPVSPMFRNHRPKYGYGDFTADDTKTLLKLLAVAGAVYYFILRKM